MLSKLMIKTGGSRDIIAQEACHTLGSNPLYASTFTVEKISLEGREIATDDQTGKKNVQPG